MRLAHSTACARAIGLLIMGALCADSLLAQTSHAGEVRAAGEGTRRIWSYNREFRPASQPLLSARKANTTVALKRAEDCAACPGHRRFLLEIKDADTGRTARFELANETAQIDELHVSAKSRIVVVGRVLPHSSIVTIIDSGTGMEVDAFYCYVPSVSANGELIAFVKVYPAHGPGEFSDEYLIYDLNRSPEQNRGPRSRVLTNHVDVGLPVYPPGAQNTPGDNLHVDASRQHHRMSSGLFWLESDRVLAFADRANAQVSLVWVDLSGGTVAPRVSAIPLMLNEIVDADRCGEYKGQPELAFTVSDILNLPDERGVRLLIEPANADCLRTDSIEIGVR